MPLGESEKDGQSRERNPIKRFLKVLGPGLITGAADDDPSGIGTYTQAGASLGFATLWTAIVTFPLMAVVQFLCAKIGMVSGMGLAGVLRKHYSRAVLYPAVLGLVVANTINAGTDIGAIAAAINRIGSVLHPAGGDGLRDDLEKSFADEGADDNFWCDEQAFSSRHRWERQIVMVVSCAGPDVVRPQVHGSQPYRQDIWP